MGTTMHYEGTAKKENVMKILRCIEDSALSNGWHINTDEPNSIIVSPHPDSESIVIRFNEDQRFSGFVKTGLAPTDIHKQVVKLFYEIKPFLKRLAIEDESGYWLEYIERVSDHSTKELTEFPTLSEKDVIKSEELLKLPLHASEFDRNFWNTNPNYIKPFMHVPTVRDRMGYDLFNGQYILTAEEMVHVLGNEGFAVIADWKDEIFNFINLATLWAWKRASGMKETKMKRNKCVAFAWALARGCHGFGGGFLNQTHRRAYIAIDNLEQKEGEASPIRSLEILYSLFDFVGLR